MCFHYASESSFELRVASLFNNLVVNETRDEVEAEFLDHQYILPRESCFYMVWCHFVNIFPFFISGVIH